MYVPLNVLLVVALQCSSAFARGPKDPNPLDGVHEYLLYATIGRVPKRIHGTDGSAIDNCGVWVKMNRKDIVAPPMPGTFLRADPKTHAFLEEPHAYLRSPHGVYLGSVNSDEWDEAKAVALHSLRLPPPIGLYAQPWCLRAATALKRKLAGTGQLYMNQNHRSAVAGSVGLSPLIGVLGVTARYFFKDEFLLRHPGPSSHLPAGGPHSQASGAHAGAIRTAPDTNQGIERTSFRTALDRGAESFKESARSSGERNPRLSRLSGVD